MIGIPYGSIRDCFTALHTLCALPLHLSLQPVTTMGPCISFTVFPFSECHAAAITQDPALPDWLPSLSNMRLRSLHVFSWLNSSFHF